MVLWLLFVAAQACELPMLSAGDFNVTSLAQFKKVIKEEEFFLLAVAAKWCNHCCKAEPTLNELHQTLQSLEPTIKLVRVDSAQHEFINSYIRDAESLPQIYAVKKGAFTRYNDAFEVNRILYFMDRVIQPIIPLETEEEVDEFFKPGDLKKYLRVVAFIIDEERDADSYFAQFQKTAEGLTTWLHAASGLVTDKALIKSLRDKKKYTNFLNSVVISRKPGEFKILDFAELESEQIKSWVFRNGVGLVEHLNAFNFQVYKSIGLPLLIMFVDKEDVKSQDYIYTFERVAEIFEDQVKFVWMYGHEQKKTMRSLGLLEEVYPSVAFNLNENRQLAFDQKLPITRDNLHAFVQAFIEGKRDALNTEKGKNSEIEQAYRDTVQLTAAEFDSKVLREGNDVCVLFYSSVDSPESLSMAPYFNKLALRFAELEFPNVQVYRFDIAVQSVPRHIRSETFPAVYLFPAFHKKPPYPVYSGPGKTLPLMFFVANHADIEIELPDLPHLSPDQVVEYYKQKAALPLERQQAVEEANERRHWEL
mmetsp:Transcript_16906/g.30271  ORF Transcript_16906/g.30271 Transcript_16906/m.30271 type:complete len:534 (+) Transcript_16906:14256-15857(+)